MFIRSTTTFCLLIISCFVTPAQGTAQKAAAETTMQSVDQPYLKATSRRIAALLERSHYSKAEFNDKLSAKAFEHLFDVVDLNNSYFTLSDIEALAQYRLEFVDMVASAKLELADVLLNKVFAIIDVRLTNAMTTIATMPKKPVLQSDFTFPANRHKTNEQLQLFWHKRLRQEAAYLALDGLNDAQVKALLIERYTRLQQKWRSKDADDKFNFLINAFTQSHDINSNYLTTQTAQKLTKKFSGEYSGWIGVKLTLESDKVVVASSNDTAKKAGIAVEDHILGIKRNKQWQYAYPENIDDLSDWLDFGSDQSVTFKLLKGGLGHFRVETVSVPRLAQQKLGIETKFIGADDNTALIKIPSFYNELSKDIAAQLEILKAKKINRLILDLRGNGGGSLGESISTAGLFITKGPIVQIRNASGKVVSEGDTDGLVWFKGALVLLVDEVSAAGTEIFAAAIQDHGVGVVVGQRTYGRGTIQQHRGLGRIYDLFEKPLGSIQYTIAAFYRITGKGFQPMGIQPDIVTQWKDGQVKRPASQPLNPSSVSALNYRLQGKIKPLINKLSRRAKQVSDLDYALTLTDELASLIAP